MIEIKLNTPEQLLNSFDPAPFRTRDLDDKAADYILERAEEAASGEKFRLILDLPADQAARGLAQELPSAVQNSFSVRANAVRRQLRELFRLGRLSLVIGLGVLGLCILVIQLLDLPSRQTTVAQMTEQGLFILGWVAIWRPLEIFLYDWWPLKARINLLERLVSATVEIRPR